MFESPSHTIQNTNPCVDSGSPFQAANVYKASMEVKKKKNQGDWDPAAYNPHSEEERDKQKHRSDQRRAS